MSNSSYEARYYKKLNNNSTQCVLCPHFCIIADGDSGFCRSRQNTNGILYAINYGECVSLAMDPIEKKPLYHFYPGSYVLSTASNSCNLACQFCQNSEISQYKTQTKFVSPEQMVETALSEKSIGIAYTYTEPLTWFEYIMDTAKLAYDKGLKNILVTNGMINPEPLQELIPYIDAANIDLKSMDESFYKKSLKGNLQTVLETIKVCKKLFHIEITNLLIPGHNDSPELISKLIDFVAEIGVDTPLHFSRYFPHYNFDVPPTPAATLEFAYKLAKEKLYYVYAGNIEIPDASNTYCPQCNNLLIRRHNFNAEMLGVTENKQTVKTKNSTSPNGNKCSKCKRQTDIISY
jgi:pyruvate formate lyase activating enzyme